MSMCYETYDVVVQLTGDDSGQRVARIDPGDYRDSDAFQYDRKVGGGGAFDIEQLPALLTAARRHFARPVSAVWVCRKETDSPDDVPELPWLVPTDYEPGPLDYGRTMIVLGNRRATKKMRRKFETVWADFLAGWDDPPYEDCSAHPLDPDDDDPDL